MPKQRAAHSSATADNKIWVIGGVLRRTVLPVADQANLRPTPHRVRETLFNWLAERLTGSSCLDLFAGTGALGVEAASRGASSVVLNEPSTRAAKLLSELVTRLAVSSDVQTRTAAGAMSVQRDDAMIAVHRAIANSQCFDIIFVDPPFQSDFLKRLLPEIPRILAPGGLAYVECGAALEPGLISSYGMQIHRQDRAGQVHYHLLEAH